MPTSQERSFTGMNLLGRNYPFATKFHEYANHEKQGRRGNTCEHREQEYHAPKVATQGPNPPDPKTPATESRPIAPSTVPARNAQFIKVVFRDAAYGASYSGDSSTIAGPSVPSGSMPILPFRVVGLLRAPTQYTFLNPFRPMMSGSR